MLVAAAARRQQLGRHQRHCHIEDAASCARADRRLPAAAVHKLLRPHHHSSSWSNRQRYSPDEVEADAVEGVAAITATAAADDAEVAVALATDAFWRLLRRTIAVITIAESC